MPLLGKMMRLLCHPPLIMPATILKFVDFILSMKNVPWSPQFFASQMIVVSCRIRSGVLCWLQTSWSLGALLPIFVFPPPISHGAMCLRRRPYSRLRSPWTALSIGWTPLFPSGREPRFTYNVLSISWCWLSTTGTLVVLFLSNSLGGCLRRCTCMCFWLWSAFYGRKCLPRLFVLPRQVVVSLN